MSVIQSPLLSPAILHKYRPFYTNFVFPFVGVHHIEREDWKIRCHNVGKCHDKSSVLCRPNLDKNVLPCSESFAHSSSPPPLVGSHIGQWRVCPKGSGWCSQHCSQVDQNKMCTEAIFLALMCTWIRVLVIQLLLWLIHVQSTFLSKLVRE